MTEKNLLDEITRKAREREAAFFEWYDKTEPYLHLYNTRMIFDLAYDKGYEVGVARGEEFEQERLANPFIDEGDTRDIEPEPEELEESDFVNRPIDDYGDEINSDDYINYLNNN
jgi:hypothetical protein